MQVIEQAEEKPSAPVRSQRKQTLRMDLTSWRHYLRMQEARRYEAEMTLFWEEWKKNRAEGKDEDKK